MSQQQLLNRAGDTNTHIPSALQTPVGGLISWSAFNAGMAKTGVGLVDELATKTGWDKLQATLGLDSYDATEAGTLSLTAAAVTTSIDLAAAAGLRLAGAVPSDQSFRDRRYRRFLASWPALRRWFPVRSGKLGAWEFSMSTLRDRRYRRSLAGRCPALGRWVATVRRSPEWDLLKKCRNQVVHRQLGPRIVYATTTGTLPSTEIVVDGQYHAIDVLVQRFSTFGETTFELFCDAVLTDFPEQVS